MSEKQTISEQARLFAGKKGSAPGMHPPFRRLLLLMIAAAVLLVIVLGFITGYLEKWLWMRQLDYAGIFWTLLSVQWAMFCSAFVFAFLYLWVNLRQAVRNSAAFRKDGRAGRPANLSGAAAITQAGIDFSPRLLKLAVVLVSAGVALFFALGFYANWDTYLRFRYGGSFGVSDPLYGVDVGFYIFHLPFYGLVQTSLMLLTVLALARTEQMSAAQFQKMVNHESGLLGVSETSSDMRDLLERETQDVRAAEAVALFCYQVRKWIGAFAAALGGLDTLVFAGGIGENAPPVRERICDGLGFLGVELDRERNVKNAPLVSSDTVRVKVRVIHTDEELMIARSTACVLNLGSIRGT